jgi:glycerophosphoryl diester phosphodiesterase
MQVPFACTAALLVASLVAAAAADRAFNVAHRGASAYVPEHTIEAYTLAVTQGADYVEQDLGLTRDNVLVCLHDPTLERTTDVETKFPDRATEETGKDGVRVKRWYVDDLTLAEVKTLDAGSWFNAKYAGARVPTFQEAIDLVKGRAGIFPELKTPGRLKAKGFDMERAVADLLRRNGLAEATVKGRPAVHLQSFEETSIRRLAELLPTVPRTFLIGTAEAAERWLTAAALKEMRGFATGVGPQRQLVEKRPALVAEAHAAGLTVVPWTFRQGTGTREAVAADMRRFVEEYKVDGLFTDNPDLFPRR